MMENHSYDNYLGMLGRGDGFTRGPDGKPTNACPDAAGSPLRAFHMANTCQLPKQPSQAWNATHTQWHNGEMDGFVRAYYEFTQVNRTNHPETMGLLPQDQVPITSFLAQNFGVCDQWFAPVPTSTLPNRLMFLAGTTAVDATGSILPPVAGTFLRHRNATSSFYSRVVRVHPGAYRVLVVTNGAQVSNYGRPLLIG